MLCFSEYVSKSSDMCQGECVLKRSDACVLKRSHVCVLTKMMFGRKRSNVFQQEQ